MTGPSAATRLSIAETELLERVDTWIAAHRDELVGDIIDWVSIPSVSDASLSAPGAPFGPGVARVLARAVERAEELGFSTESHDGYAVSLLGSNGSGEASGSNNADTHEIGLVSHLDVVPAGENWAFEPFESFERDGFVVGRGTSDDKGPAVGDLYLLRLFRDLAIPLRRRLRVIYGGSEETGMDDLKYYAQHAPIPEVSIVTDAGFPVNFAQKGGLNLRLSIPTGDDLATLHGGVAHNAVPASAQVTLAGRTESQVDRALAALPEEVRSRLDVESFDGGVILRSHGIAGHAASPEGTLNAILVLIRALAESVLLTREDQDAAETIATLLKTPYGDGAGTAREDAISGRLTQNGGIVGPHEGGLELHIDIRYPVTVPHEELVDALRRAVAPIGGTVLDYRNAQPFHVDRDSSTVKVLQGAFDDVFGIETEPYAMGGGTHSRVLPNAITFGPGFDHVRDALAGAPELARPAFVDPAHGGAHGPDEFVAVDRLVSALRVYVIAITRLDAALA